MAEITPKRHGELARGVFAILRDAPDGLPAAEVLRRVAETVPPTPFESTYYESTPTARRYEKIVRSSTIGAVKAGWLIKEKGQWSLTEDGRKAYEEFTDPEAFFLESRRLYRVWKKAQPEVPSDDSEEVGTAAAATIAALSPRTRAIGVAALGIAAAILAYVLIGRDDGSFAVARDAVPVDTRPAIPADAVTLQELKSQAASQSRPLYWAGARADATYELTRSADGRTYVRYLTGDAVVGDPAADFVTVATYPQSNGFDAVTTAATKAGNIRIDLPAGGVAVTSRTQPTSVYLSYPGADYQVEVYAPDAATAVDLVKSGKVKPVGGGTPVATGVARGLSLRALRALARSEPRIYWAGPRTGTTYEVTRTPGGRTFVRYLTGGAKIGDPDADFLVIATYAQQEALLQVEAAGNGSGVVKLELEGGGLAVYDPVQPTSVYLAFPDVDSQIEVYSPKKGEARSLVERGRIVPIS